MEENNNNEIININNIDEKNEENNINENNNNNFIIDSQKYKFDYTSRLNCLDNILNPITKEKFLIKIFLMSSNLNMLNKLIFLEKLYKIIDSENNIQMIYYISSKILKYAKTGIISIYSLNTNIFFCSEFLGSNQNYFFAYKYFVDLKQYNNSISFEKKILNEINDFIKNFIDFYENYFMNLLSSEQLSNLDKIINKILNQKELFEIEEKINKIEDKNNPDNQYLYLINKTWLQNAKIFIGNYLFAKATNMTSEFFKDSFNHENVLSIFLSEEKIDKPLKTKTYYPFPGPINNFPITDFKPKLYDPDSVEENILLKKYLLPIKDFYWINCSDWKILKEAFNCTNEIRRKKEELEMIKISAIIFDSRIPKYKNESIDYLNKKVIQISKKKSIKDFETKILRCLDYEINTHILKNKKNENINDDNEKVINFYKINKKNKDIIIEMFLSFINDIQSYESIFFQEISFSESDKNKNIENIFKKYNPSTEILIIEINDNKIATKFLKPIVPILNQDGKYKYSCSICDKELNDINIEKNICKICSMYLYCSKKCLETEKNKDKENIKIVNHSNIHKMLSELIRRPFNIKNFLSESFYEKVYTMENKDKSKGLVGLFNLGNTCYMNCSLQCLSNTKDLTKYFMCNYYQNELNLQTNIGSNGVLVKSYSDLLNLMWLSKFSKITPYFFRLSFCVSTHKFMNNQQQDAMEFISILLNYLHEDLNRIKEKPYKIIEGQRKGESDILASQRFYNYYLQRDNSIIIDLFNGQFQNIIKCSTCKTENKTYEAFNNISLPIPEEHNFYIIKFFTHLHCKYITMNINSETTFEDLIKKGTNYLSKKILDSYKEIKKSNQYNENYLQVLLEKNIEIVQLDKNKIIKIIFSQPDNEEEIQKNYKKKLKDYINIDKELVLFEREIIPDYNENIYVYPITSENNDNEDINVLSYPIVFSVKHDLTLENFQNLIVEKLNHILIQNKNLKNSHLIDLHILHSNKNLNTGIMKLIKEYSKCRFCGSDYSEKKYCPLYYYFNKNDTVSKIFKYQKYSEPIIILARSSYYDLKKEVYQGYNFEENNILNKYKNIYDSFNQFGKQEILGEDNLWNCPNCKTRSIIGKAIKIYRPPNYLIIQLKRFKKKGNGFFNFLEKEKNDTFVSFPTKNLDISNYIEGPDKINAIYNLYGIINHKSLLGFNHFTAFCRNDKRWVEYDDKTIDCDIKNPVTNEAYILFYIKKNIDENY